MAFFCFTVTCMKKITSITFLLFFVLIFGFAQDITTAGAFFSAVSERYGKIRDYVVDMRITIGSSSQYGTAMFKRPDRLRIDFRSPAEQFIVFNGNTLSIYLPQYGTILSQEVEQSSAGAASLSTPQGLSLIKRAYTIAYESSADPVPLDEGSSEKVIVLIMNRKSAAETFRTLRVSISPDSQLIRRIEAVPISGGKITFNFSNYRINAGIRDKNFVFDSPPTAQVSNNFLFAD